MLEQVKCETACCDHLTDYSRCSRHRLSEQGRSIPRKGVVPTCLFDSAPLPRKPAQKPELPLRVQILNNVGELQPHEFEFDLALRWHGALLESGSSVGRLAPELCCRVLRHLQLEKLIEQRFDIGCLDRISSMKEHMVFAFDEVARGQVTCGATCCHCPSRATTAPMSAPPIRTVKLFLRVMRNVKGLTPVLSQCRVIAGSDCCMITLAMCCLFSVVPVLTKYFRRSRKIPIHIRLKSMLWSLTTLHKPINSLSFNSSQCCKNVCNASVERIEKSQEGL